MTNPRGRNANSTPLERARTRLWYDVLARLRPRLLSETPAKWTNAQPQDGITQYIAAHPLPRDTGAGADADEARMFQSRTVWRWCVRDRARMSVKTLRAQRAHDVKLVSEWRDGLEGLNDFQHFSLEQEYGLDHDERFEDGPLGGRFPQRRPGTDEKARADVQKEENAKQMKRTSGPSARAETRSTLSTTAKAKERRARSPSPSVSDSDKGTNSERPLSIETPTPAASTAPVNRGKRSLASVTRNAKAKLVASTSISPRARSTRLRSAHVRGDDSDAVPDSERPMLHQRIDPPAHAAAKRTVNQRRRSLAPVTLQAQVEPIASTSASTQAQSSKPRPSHVRRDNSDPESDHPTHPALHKNAAPTVLEVQAGPSRLLTDYFSSISMRAKYIRPRSPTEYDNDGQSEAPDSPPPRKKRAMAATRRAAKTRRVPSASRVEDEDSDSAVAPAPAPARRAPRARAPPSSAMARTPWTRPRVEESTMVNDSESDEISLLPPASYPHPCAGPTPAPSAGMQRHPHSVRPATGIPSSRVYPRAGPSGHAHIRPSVSPRAARQDNRSRAPPPQTTEHGSQRGAVVIDLTGETRARAGPGPLSMAHAAARNHQHATASGVPGTRGAPKDVTVIDLVDEDEDDDIEMYSDIEMGYGPSDWTSVLRRPAPSFRRVKRGLKSADKNAGSPSHMQHGARALPATSTGAQSQPAHSTVPRDTALRDPLVQNAPATSCARAAVQVSARSNGVFSDDSDGDLYMTPVPYSPAQEVSLPIVLSEGPSGDALDRQISSVDRASPSSRALSFASDIAVERELEPVRTSVAPSGHVLPRVLLDVEGKGFGGVDVDKCATLATAHCSARWPSTTPSLGGDLSDFVSARGTSSSVSSYPTAVRGTPAFPPGSWREDTGPAESGLPSDDRRASQLSSSLSSTAAHLGSDILSSELDATSDIAPLAPALGTVTVTGHASAPAPEFLERPDVRPTLEDMHAQPFAPAALAACAEIAGFARDLNNASAVPLPNKVLNGILMRAVYALEADWDDEEHLEGASRADPNDEDGDDEWKVQAVAQRAKKMWESGLRTRVGQVSSAEANRMMGHVLYGWPIEVSSEGRAENFS